MTAIEAQGKRAREPYKQTMERLRNAKVLAVRFVVDDYFRRLELRRARQQQARNARAKERRAAERNAPAMAIEAEGQLRLKSLQLALRARRGDKALEQLVGREEELAHFWVAMKLVALETHARSPTNAEIGALFESRTGMPCNKNQARTRRKLVAALEKRDWVWLKFAPPRA